MKVIRDDDIGRCDVCGSEDGRRLPTTVRGQFNDGPALYRLWLCDPCAAERREARRAG